MLAPLPVSEETLTPEMIGGVPSVAAVVVKVKSEEVARLPAASRLLTR